MKFEWVNLVRGRLAEGPGTGGTRPRSVLRPACPVGVESALKQAFMQVVEAFEALPPGYCCVQPFLAGTSRLARHPGFHRGRQLPGNPLEFSESQYRLLEGVLATFVFVMLKLQNAKTSIKRFQRMLFGGRTEHKRNVLERTATGADPQAQDRKSVV